NYKFDSAAEELGKLSRSVASPAFDRELPQLAAPDPASRKYSGAELYERAIRSVVLIEAGNRSGSGVCVGRADIILTNDHVVGDAIEVNVTSFSHQDGSLTRRARVQATVLVRSPEQDLAVLKLENPGPLEPMPVAVASPQAGNRIYAIGSP